MKSRWMNIHIAQAVKPENRNPRTSAIAALRPTVAMLPRSL